MTLIPKSLFGRLMAAIVVAVAVLALIVAALIVRERNEFAYRGGDAAEIVDAIAATSRRLAGADAGTRAEMLEDMRSRPFRVGHLHRARPPAPPAEAARWARTYRKRVQRELGEAYGVVVEPAVKGRRVIRLSPATMQRLTGDVADSPPELPVEARRPRAADRAFDVIVVLPDDAHVAFRVTVPPKRLPMPRQVFVELAALVLVIGVVLFFVTRTITRPLSRLAQAAEAAGRGEKQAPLEETGVRELRDATRAFNVMQERLHRYLDSRTRVVAAMSHDLRTPLTRLRLRAEKIDDPALRERFVADLDQMSDMVKSSLNLFSGSNDQERREPVDIDALIAGLRDDFADMGQAIAVTGSAGAALRLQPGAIRRCLTNLLTNAVKFGDRASISIENDGDVVIVRVADDGPGIPPEALESVFEPFFRLEGSRNRQTGGTGLGLTIARDIAQAHGGQLVLCNRPSGGLEAVLSLPRSRD